MPSTSRTKPRMKASSAETASTPSTTRSTQVIEPPREGERGRYILPNERTAKPRVAARPSPDPLPEGEGFRCSLSLRERAGVRAFAEPRHEVGQMPDLIQPQPLGRGERPV